MSKPTVTKTEIVKSPIENFFNLPESKKLEPSEEEPSQELATQDVGYDEKDNENEELYDEIHHKALSAHDRILDDIEDIDPKYGARNYEVASTYLNIALHAVEKRAKLKEHKDKLSRARSKVNVTNNKAIIINTSDLIKQLRTETIEGDVVDVTPKQDNTNE